MPVTNNRDTQLLIIDIHYATPHTWWLCPFQPGNSQRASPSCPYGPAEGRPWQPGSQGDNAAS